MTDVLRVLAIDRSECQDGKVCPAFIEVNGRVAVVGKPLAAAAAQWLTEQGSITGRRRPRALAITRGLAAQLSHADWPAGMPRPKCLVVAGQVITFVEPVEERAVLDLLADHVGPGEEAMMAAGPPRCPDQEE